MASISYSKLLDPVSDIVTCMESILAGAFGSSSGDQRECYKRIHAYAWGLHTLVMDVITAVGIESAATRPAVLKRFHSLKRPIRSNLDNLLAGFDGALTDDQQEILAFVDSAVSLIERMMKNVWHYSLLWNNQLDYKPGACELNQALRGARQILDDERLLRHLGEARVYGDARWLSYAFDEIAMNIRRHGDIRGLSVEAQTLPRRLDLTLFDAGPGFVIRRGDDPFAAFWQADIGNGGLGLGLYLARAFIDACGGDISISSRPGSGALVKVSLRLAQAAN